MIFKKTIVNVVHYVKNCIKSGQFTMKIHCHMNTFLLLFPPMTCIYCNLEQMFGDVENGKHCKLFITLYFT